MVVGTICPGAAGGAGSGGGGGGAPHSAGGGTGSYFGGGADGGAEYDILYDDDEVETGLSSELVRAVVRKPFASRLLLSTSPEALAPAPQETGDDREDLEESIQYEFGSTRDSGLSPATPQSADSDSLALSLSAGN